MRFHAPLRLVALVAAAVLAAPAARAAGQNELFSAVKDYESGNYTKAALAFYDVSESPADPEMGYRAEYYLALALFKMGLPHAALTYDKIIIDQGPNHPYYLKAIENSLEVMDAVGDKSIIPSMLDKEYNDAFEKLKATPEGKAALDRINFLIALWSYSQKKWDDAVDFLNTVPADSAVYARARYLRGLDAARRAQAPGVGDPSKFDNEAIKLFQSVIDLKDTEKLKYSDLADLKELSQLGLARVRYAEAGFAAKRGEQTGDLFMVAFEEYARVPRFSRHWRDALFEGAYSAFMGEQPGQALGFLETLHAPVAGDQLLPESWLLRGYIYYTLCLFDESRAAAKKMQDTYGAIRGQITELVGAGKDPDYYFELLQAGRVNGTSMPPMVRNELLVDETLRGRRSYILELGAEAEKLRNIEDFKRKALGKVLVEAVEQQRNMNIQIAGKTVLQKFKTISLMLEELDTKGEELLVEISETDGKLTDEGHDGEALLRKQTLYRPGMPAKGVEYWDFEGEYWPDELGFYRSTVKNACPVAKAAAQ